MSVAKSPNRWGVMVETEAVYATAPTMDITEDGVLVLEAPEVDLEWVNDGDRGVTLRRGGKCGLSGSVDIVTELLTASAAFSALVTPPNVHDLLQAAGHIATLDPTASSENYKYTPNSDVTAWTSVGAEVFIDGEKNILRGAFADLTIASDSGEVPAWTFPLTGIGALPTDATVPAIAYDQVTKQPAKAAGMTINIGDFVAGIVRSFSFAKNNGDPDARVDEQSADLHRGFVGTIGTPTLELVVEATALQATPFHAVGGLDPRQLEKLATAIPVALQWGTAQYGKTLIDLPLAELIEFEPGREGNITTWTLTFAAQRSTPIANDAFSITIL